MHAKPNAANIMARLERAEVVPLNPKLLTAIVVMMRSPTWLHPSPTTEYQGQARLLGGVCCETNEISGEIPRSIASRPMTP